MKLLTKTADRLVDLILPRATASASTVQLYCACWGHVKWYKDCELLGTMLRCGGCNVRSSTSC